MPARADQLGSAAIDVDDGRVLDARPSIAALRVVAALVAGFGAEFVASFGAGLVAAFGAGFGGVAAVADLVPSDRRSAGYGTVGYGPAWLAGSALTGLLDEHGPGLAAGSVIVVQAAAPALLASVLHRDAHR